MEQIWVHLDPYVQKNVSTLSLLRGEGDCGVEVVEKRMLDSHSCNLMESDDVSSCDQGLWTPRLQLF